MNYHKMLNGWMMQSSSNTMTVFSEGDSLKSEESHVTEVMTPQSVITEYKPILRKYSTTFSSGENNSSLNSLSTTHSQSKTITWDLDGSSVEQTTIEIFPRGSDSLFKTDLEGPFQAEEESDRWTWSLESTLETVETEPSERYLNMIRGREYFVQQSLKQQEMYMQLNNEQPGLFKAVVITDNVEVAVKNLGTVCYELFCNWKNHNNSENPLKNSAYGNFVQDRVTNLLNELNEVSPTLVKRGIQ